MKRGRRWWWYLLLATMALAVIAVARRQRALRVSRTDGLTVGWVGSSFGTQHFGPPQRWNRLKANLPQRVLAWGSLPRPIPIRTTHPQLVLWFEVGCLASASNAAGSVPELWCEWSGAARALNAVPLVRLPEFQTAAASGRPLGAKPSAGSWCRQAFATAVFPRRTSPLKVRVFGGEPAGDGQLLAEFRVPSPVQGPFPVWAPDPLPVEREAGGVQARLTEFVLDEAMPGQGALRWAVARMDVSGGGHPLSGWEVEALTLCDPTGNRVASCPAVGRELLPVTVEAGNRGQLAVRFPWLGWPGEPVWRVVLGLRPGGGHLGPGDEIAELWNLRVPAADRISWIRRDVVLAGKVIKVLALVGEQASLPGRPHDVFDQCTLELAIPPLAEGWRLALRSSDSAVRVVRVSGVLAEGNQSAGLKVSPGRELVNLTLVLYREREFGFVLGGAE